MAFIIVAMKKTFPLLIFLLAGCAQFVSLPPLEPLPDMEKILWKVQYFPQEKWNDCSAACMTTMAVHCGIQTNVERMTHELKTTRLRGVIPIEMLYWARVMRLNAKLYEGGLNDMRKNIQEGRPLILFLHPLPDLVRMTGLNFGHYVVAVGYDDIGGFAIVHTGGSQFENITYRQLIHQWRRSGYLTLSITK